MMGKEFSCLGSFFLPPLWCCCSAPCGAFRTDLKLGCWAQGCCGGIVPWFQTTGLCPFQQHLPF